MVRQNLISILCCPKCSGALQLVKGRLECHLLHKFAVVEGIPVLVPGELENLGYEKELFEFEGYFTIVQQILDALAPAQVVIDIGAGRRLTDSSSIVRTDIYLTSHVDAVADAHRLPFRDASVDFIHASAVFEHLRKPFAAADEIRRVLKPGGHVYAECAFVYPFHGYPAMYFNASVEGMRSLFDGFDEEFVGAAPWQMPSFAVETLLAEYLRFFKPASAIEEEWVAALKALDRFPIHDFDHRFTQADASRIAAAVTFVGRKPLGDAEPPLPKPILGAWQKDPVLQRRYPDPFAVASNIAGSTVDNLMMWARREGCITNTDIARCLDEALRFNKRLLE